jgi:hypothetical protein
MKIAPERKKPDQKASWNNQCSRGDRLSPTKVSGRHVGTCETEDTENDRAQDEMHLSALERQQNRHQTCEHTADLDTYGPKENAEKCHEPYAG